MKDLGAAVIAAYKGATDNRSHRLVGWVEPGGRFKRLNGLLCLSLSKAKVVDASISYLGNLAPRSCTVQTCHNRAKGRLISLVLGTKTARSVGSLHYMDVEWLVTNFLLSQRICASVWSGGRSYENIDHAGYASSGREILAQTTVSTGFVGKKASRLLELQSPRRALLCCTVVSTARSDELSEIGRSGPRVAPGLELRDRPRRPKQDRLVAADSQGVGDMRCL